MREAMSEEQNRQHSLTAKTNEGKQQKRRGFLSSDAIIIMVVIGMILGAIYMARGQIYKIFGGNTFVSYIGTLQAAIDESTVGASTLTNLSSEALATAKVVPPRWISGTNIASPFGSNVTISGTDAGGGTGGYMTDTIQIPNVPRQECITAMTYDFGEQLVSRTPAGDGTSGGPSTLSGANTACSSDLSNTISLEFRHVN